MQMDDGTIEVWGRALGRNPLYLNTSGARQWKDGSYAPSCREYRFSEGGQYTGATGSGAYMIQPYATNPPFRVFCDMAFDANGKKGGWTLFAHYSMDSGARPTYEFHPFVHFEQTTSGVLTERQQAPDLNSTTFFGHINYEWLPVENRDFRIRAVGYGFSCEQTRPTGITAWKNGTTSLSSGFLKTYSYQQSSWIGLANGGFGGPCHSEEKYSHVRMRGFLYCASSSSPQFGISNASNSNGELRAYCRGSAMFHLSGQVWLYVR
jgi:hypothetical protein